jgi:hypothetical protein
VKLNNNFLKITSNIDHTGPFVLKSNLSVSKADLIGININRGVPGRISGLPGRISGLPGRIWISLYGIFKACRESCADDYFLNN